MLIMILAVVNNLEVILLYYFFATSLALMYQELLKIIEANLMFVSAKIINVKFRYMYADLNGHVC